MVAFVREATSKRRSTAICVLLCCLAVTRSATAFVGPQPILSSSTSRRGAPFDGRRVFHRTTTSRSSSRSVGPDDDDDDDVGASATATLLTEEDFEEEKQEEVVGAKFFGGSAEKEDLYDAAAERDAMAVFEERTVVREYVKWDNTDAFPDERAKRFAMGLQDEINRVLDAGARKRQRKSKKQDAAAAASIAIYTAETRWDSPFATDKNAHPLEELKRALSFYTKLDVSVIAAKSSSTNDDEIDLRWEISLVWPTAWEARVLLTGTSRVAVDAAAGTVVRQTDFLDDGGDDLVRALRPQLLPRFWDVYHIGMTPGAEVGTRLPSSGGGLLAPYRLFETPPRLVLRPSLVDTLDREARQAQMIPDHAFATIVRTMGKRRQTYVPTSPVEVSLRRRPKKNDSGEQRRSETVIDWTIAVPPEVTRRASLPVPNDGDDDRVFGGEATCAYEYQPRRRMATLPFGGAPQDEGVAAVREKLYAAVTRDGLRPKLYEDGRPRFLYLQNDAKACFTKNGLGMAVYDWRPAFVNSNEIGIELEL